MNRKSIDAIILFTVRATKSTWQLNMTVSYQYIDCWMCKINFEGMA